MRLLENIRYRLSAPGAPRRVGKRAVATLAALVAVVLGISLIVGWYWSRTPDLFDVRQVAQARYGEGEPVTGYVTAATLERVMQTLLDKPGGYLSNDVAPPGVLLDNMPSWEYGVLVQSRDLARALRNDMSRSRSQSVEDIDLAQLEPRFNFSNDSWIFPSTEAQYREGLHFLDNYLTRLGSPTDQNTQFYARADNLRDWLGTVNKRLGSLSQRLSASVGQYRVNTDLAGDKQARQATATGAEVYSETPWTEIDDVFYEARGATWALIHFLRAAEVDFADVLRDKNAQASLRQIIRELEGAQRPIYSPVVLNGSGYGVFANHSLTMASYIARANAALIDLRNLLSEG